MEARSSNVEKGESKQEATASPPLDEEEEPPPLEEVSEPRSKASTPRLSSARSDHLGKGYSPISYSDNDFNPSSYFEKARSPSSIRAEETVSPPLYTENAGSPPRPYTKKPQNPSPHVVDFEGGENSTISAHVSPPKHMETNNSQTKAGIGSSATTVPNEKIDAKPSLYSSIPSITWSVKSAAKHVSFASRSLSSRSMFGSSPSWKGSDRRMKIVEIGLRCGGIGLALIAFSVMAATRQTQQGAGSTFTMKFTDYQAYSYLVAVNIISFAYSCWQFLLLVQSRTGGVFTMSRDSDNRLSTYICDQVLAFLLFSASSSAATAAQLSRHGLHNIWPPACSTWSLGLFCSKADAAVAMSFLSSFLVIVSSVISGYRAAKHLQE